MIDASHVTAVIVTRGDVDLSEILASLPFPVAIVWDNSKRPRDLGVLGRYAAAVAAQTPLVYVQDDDCVLAPESFAALLDAYNEVPLDERPVLVANMPAPFRVHYTDSCLVGFGAIFPTALPRVAFTRLRQHYYHEWLRGECPAEMIELFQPTNALPEGSSFFTRCCDVVFTALTSRVLVDVPYRNLPWADAPDRMYRQPGHVAERQRMLNLARKVRDG